MNKYIKEHYNVNKDSMEWALLKTSAFYKKELRVNQAEIEIIDSYIICMNDICNQIKNGHIISDLWKECKKIYNDKKLDYYDELIQTIEILDNNGQKYRYVKDKNGNEFENKPIFINVELINTDISKLKNELF